jgi:flagellar motor switch protein FliN/FliY
MSDSTRNWLLDQWVDESGRTLQYMTDAQPAIRWEAADLPPDLSTNREVYKVEVTLSEFPGSRLWIAIPPDAAREMGRRALAAAGIDDAGPDDIQNTCAEIVQQSHSGLAQAISQRLKQSVSSHGLDADELPADCATYRIEITFPDSPALSTYLLFAPSLLKHLNIGDSTQPGGGPDIAPAVNSDAPGTAVPTLSRTFDVLLDVSMPVSVSFGRTEMLIKEVLKLTTGSIVELDRNVAEPVDLIVNDRVIARGEVVVVDGNYGVRIHEIVSLQERFRSSTQAMGNFVRPDGA